MKKSKFSTAQLTKMALMAAIVSVSSYIIIPLPFTSVSITGQTMAVNLAALVLTPEETFFTMLCYWLLGFAGVPVFAGGASGPGKMFGPTGGYYMGFVVAAVLIALLKGQKYDRKRYVLVMVLAGLPIINGMGCIWMKFVTGMTWKAAFTASVLPFIFLDILKCAAAALIARPVQNAFYIMEDYGGQKGQERRRQGNRR